MPLDRYDKIYNFQGNVGVTLDRFTAAAIETWQKQLNNVFHIYQGSYRPYSQYSAATHMGGGAVDIWVYGVDPNHVVKVGRDLGFACWWRHPWQGDWVEHIHGIQIGNVKASDDAKNQVSQYYNHYDGLGQPDGQPYRPNPIKEFDYKAWEGDMPLTDHEINQIANAVWDHKIKNPLTPGQDNDTISMSFAVNRILETALDIENKVK